LALTLVRDHFDAEFIELCRLNTSSSGKRRNRPRAPGETSGFLGFVSIPIDFFRICASRGIES